MVTGLATIVARVVRPERLERQHAIVIVHAGHSGRGAQWPAGVVLGPRDAQRQVTADHRARDAGPFADVHRPFRGQRAKPWRRCNYRFLPIFVHTYYNALILSLSSRSSYVFFFFVIRVFFFLPFRFSSGYPACSHPIPNPRTPVVQYTVMQQRTSANLPSSGIVHYFFRDPRNDYTRFETLHVVKTIDEKLYTRVTLNSLEKYKIEILTNSLANDNS